LQFNKNIDHTFQQSYVDDKQFCNIRICTGRERMDLIIKKETRKKMEYIWEVNKELWIWHRIRWNLYIPFLNIMLYWTRLRFLTVLQNIQPCKYSSCYIRLQSSLYTHSSSYGGMQCGDSRYSFLWWTKFGTFAVNIIYWPTAHYGSLPTCCKWLLECLDFLCTFILYMFIYVTLYWNYLNYVEKCLYKTVCYYPAIQGIVSFSFCQ